MAIGGVSTDEAGKNAGRFARGLQEYPARRPEPPCGHRMLAECPLTARDWEAVYAAYLGFLHACRMISHAAHERATSTGSAPPPGASDSF